MAGRWGFPRTRRAREGAAEAVGDADPKAHILPKLTDAQQRALDALREEGIAIVPFQKFFDDALWQDLQAEMGVFVETAEAELERGVTDKQKDFLIRRYPRGESHMPVEPAVLPSDGPWLRFAAGDALLDVVNTYRNVRTKLVDFDLWYTIPTAGRSDRHASQQWHRDPEDQHVVKVFLYFSDVDEESGPFEYVRYSKSGGKHGHLWPWGTGKSGYPPSNELERLTPESDRILATGPAGTLVICDTSGFHRGGYARSKPRVLNTQTYVNKKINKPDRRKFQVDWRKGDLSEQARFALS